MAPLLSRNEVRLVFIDHAQQLAMLCTLLQLDGDHPAKHVPKK